MEERKQVQLSKGLLDMKFMKRTKERVERDEDNAVGTALYSHEITESMKSGGEMIIVEASATQCMDLMDGRVSFGGMNPAIEKFMKEAEKGNTAELENTEKDVTDVEMAQQSSLVQSVERKFKSKKQRKGGKSQGS